MAQIRALLVLANHLLNKYGDSKSSLFIGKIYLGEFEEPVLLTVAHLQRKAYGAAIMQDIRALTSRIVILSELHVVLYRLEEKGLATYISTPHIYFT